jgi:hypothetical protein
LGRDSEHNTEHEACAPSGKFSGQAPFAKSRCNREYNPDKVFLAERDASGDLKRWFVEYINHVAMYHAIRNAAQSNQTLEKETPANFDHPFPSKTDDKKSCPENAVLPIS